MHRPSLTQRQRDVLDFLRVTIAENGRPPSIQEIARAMGVTSTNGVHKTLVALERKGYIERIPNEARSIRLIDTAVPLMLPAERQAVPLIRGQSSLQPEQLRHGAIGFSTIDPRLFSCPLDECVLADVSDDAMTGDAIRKGDLVLVHELQQGAPVPASGIALVWVRGDLLVRRVTVASNRVYLRASARGYADLAYALGETSYHVIGEVAGVIRAF